MYFCTPCLPLFATLFGYVLEHCTCSGPQEATRGALRQVLKFSKIESWEHASTFRVPRRPQSELQTAQSPRASQMGPSNAAKNHCMCTSPTFCLPENSLRFSEKLLEWHRTDYPIENKPCQRVPRKLILKRGVGGMRRRPGKFHLSSSPPFFEANYFRTKWSPKG